MKQRKRSFSGTRQGSAARALIGCGESIGCPQASTQGRRCTQLRASGGGLGVVLVRSEAAHDARCEMLTGAVDADGPAEESDREGRRPAVCARWPWMRNSG